MQNRFNAEARKEFEQTPRTLAFSASLRSVFNLEIRVNPRPSVVKISIRLHRRDERVERGLGVAEQHPRVVLVEQMISMPAKPAAIERFITMVHLQRSASMMGMP